MKTEIKDIMGAMAFVVIAAIVAFALCGCVLTCGRSSPPPVDGVKQPTTTFYRFAVLYPFEVADVTLPGGVRFGKYSSDGGAPGIVTILDAAGNVYNATKRP